MTSLAIRPTPCSEMLAEPRPRDYQRQRLYRWEDSELLPRAPQLLSLPECQAHVAAIFGRRRLAVPQVRDGRGRRSACFRDDYSICLPRWQRILPIVLHEAAHGLLDFGPAVMRFGEIVVTRDRGGETADRSASSDHGPIFAAIYIALAAEYGLASAQVLRRSAIDCGLDVMAWTEMQTEHPTIRSPVKKPTTLR